MLGKGERVGIRKCDKERFMDYVENGKQEWTRMWLEMEFKNQQAKKPEDLLCLINELVSIFGLTKKIQGLYDPKA